MDYTTVLAKAMQTLVQRKDRSAWGRGIASGFPPRVFGDPDRPAGGAGMSIDTIMADLAQYIRMPEIAARYTRMTTARRFTFV